MASSSPTVELWSETQQKVLVWAPKAPALVSVVCSGLVLYLLMRDRKTRLTKVYGRLWFGIALGNLWVCLMVLIGSATAPEGTFYGAHGTDGSCKASAAVFHVVFVATTVYNGCLGVYYYVSVHKKWNDEFLRNNVEPLMHGWSIGYPLVGMIFGLAFDMYGPNETFLYCWAAPSPFGCRNRDDDIACTSGNHLRPLFVWMAGLVELNAFSFFKLLGVFAIYVTLLKQQHMMRAKYTTKSSGTTSSTGRSRRNSVARETGIQSYLFLSACLIPYTLTIILRQFEMFWRDMPYPASPAYFTFVTVALVLFPLQGVLNMVIFFRPKIKQRQRDNPDEPISRSCLAILAPGAHSNIVTSTSHSSARVPSVATSSRVAPPDAREQRREVSAILEGGSVSCLGVIETSDDVETSETWATSADVMTGRRASALHDERVAATIQQPPYPKSNGDMEEECQRDETFGDAGGGSSTELFTTRADEVPGDSGCVVGEDLPSDCREAVQLKRQRSRALLLQTTS